MKKIRFHEYLTSKGKVDQPVVKLDGDRTDPQTMPNKPPGGGKPYSVKDGKSKKSDKGFADQGDPDLKYNPKVDVDNKGKAPAKLPTVEETSMACSIANAIAKNPMLVETVIRQLKRNKALGVLVAEMLNHRETYNHISEVMAHKNYGPELCDKLVRAMNEEVAKPFHDQLDMDDEEDEDEDMSDLGDEELGIDDMEGGDDANADPGMDGMGMDPMMGTDPSMDPNAMAQPDPSMMGQDPAMMGQPDPSMMGQDPAMMGQPPQMPPNPAMQNFQRSMMRSRMRRMMGRG